MIGVSLRVLIVPVTVVRLTRAAPTLATGGRLFSPDLFLLQYNKTYDKSCISSYSFKWKYLMNGGTVWALTCCALKLSFPPWVEFFMLIPGLTIEKDNVAKFSLPKNWYQHTNSKYFLRTPLPVSERRVRSGAGEGWLCTDQLLSQLLLPEPAAFCTTFVCTNNAAF